MAATVVDNKSQLDTVLKNPAVVLFCYYGDANWSNNYQTFERFISHAASNGFICCLSDFRKLPHLYHSFGISNNTGIVVFRYSTFFAYIEEPQFDESSKFDEFDKLLGEHTANTVAGYMTPRQEKELLIPPVAHTPKRNGSNLPKKDDSGCCVVL